MTQATDKALSADTPPWQPIDSAPKDWVDETTVNLPGPVTFRAGRCIKVRGEYEGQTEEFTVHWAQSSGYGFDHPPHWFVFDCEPLDWPVTEWRELTEAENAALESDHG